MNIETVEDLANEVANWIGCYGACKANERGQEDCHDENPFCCRVGFMMEFPDRIRAAVENDKKLEQVFLTPPPIRG